MKEDGNAKSLDSAKRISKLIKTAHSRIGKLRSHQVEYPKATRQSKFNPKEEHMPFERAKITSGKTVQTILGQISTYYSNICDQDQRVNTPAVEKDKTTEYKDESTNSKCRKLFKHHKRSRRREVSIIESDLVINADMVQITGLKRHSLEGFDDLSITPRTVAPSAVIVCKYEGIHTMDQMTRTKLRFKKDKTTRSKQAGHTY